MSEEIQTSSNNFWLWKLEVIKSHEPEFFMCEKCQGKGAYLITNGQNVYYKFCPICEGNGEVNWIQHALEV